MKLPAKTYVLTETQVETNTNEGMEGMAECEELFSCKVDAHCKECNPSAHQTGGARS